jgi:hypothetical protein
MKNKLLFTMSMLLAAALLPSAFAQDPLVPSSKSLFVQSQQPVSAERLTSKTSYRAWQISLGAVAATQALDIYSSRGLRELNPVLAAPDQRFGGQAALMKLGIAGALIGVEYLVVRKHPGAAKLLWKLNLASAAVTGATAAHNFSIR